MAMLTMTKTLCIYSAILDKFIIALYVVAWAWAQRNIGILAFIIEYCLKVDPLVKTIREICINPISPGSFIDDYRRDIPDETGGTGS